MTLESWTEDLCNYIEAREEAREQASEAQASEDGDAPAEEASEPAPGPSETKKEKVSEPPGPSKKSGESFADCVSALQRGHYWDEIDVRKKVALLAGLVDHAVQTDIIRWERLTFCAVKVQGCRISDKAGCFNLCGSGSRSY